MIISMYLYDDDDDYDDGDDDDDYYYAGDEQMSGLWVPTKQFPLQRSRTRAPIHRQVHHDDHDYSR